MLEKIPTDKKGKPLMSGQYVSAEISNGTGPPRSIFGRIMFVGQDSSFVMPDMKEGVRVKNSEIEIKID